MRNSVFLGALLVSASLGVGFLLGSQARPQTEMSQLASAQLMSTDKEVKWIGYDCGDDGATVISRELPSECRISSRLSEDLLLIDGPLS